MAAGQPAKWQSSEFLRSGHLGLEVALCSVLCSSEVHTTSNVDSLIPQSD